MGRGLAILAVFATLIGLVVLAGPFRLVGNPHGTAVQSLPERTQAPHEVRSEDERNDQDDAEEVQAPDIQIASVRPVRKSEQANETSLREPIVNASPPIPPSPLRALPERAIPGFPPTPTATVTSEQLASVLKQAKHLRADGQLVAARDLLSATYLNYRTSRDQRLRLAEELEPLSWEVLRSHTLVEDGLVYEVEPGDVLVRISKPFRIPPEFVVMLNGLKNARAIRPRQHLKLVQGPLDVLIELSEFELTVLRQGTFVCRFPIGIGRDETPTPHGLNQVLDKQINPTKWPSPDDPDRRTLPPGHPENPLGTRWIGIGLGYGIHGTIEPGTVSQKSSRGCIRMRNEDIERLYDMLSEGSRVLIRP